MITVRTCTLPLLFDALPAAIGMSRVPHAARLVLMLVLLLSLSGCGLKILAPSGESSGQEVAPAKALQVASMASSQIGIYYRYGGSSPGKGFDCSGLIWWAYRQNGINVPRVAKDQATTGRNVPAAQMRPGDILVFSTSYGLHTGLYTGSGQFVHAPSSGKRVRLDSVRNAYWKPRLRAVRRVYTGR